MINLIVPHQKSGCSDYRFYIVALCKLGMTSKHQLIANPSCGSGWTNNFQL